MASASAHSLSILYAMSSKSALALAWLIVSWIFFAISSRFSHQKLDLQNHEKERVVFSASNLFAPFASISAFCV